MISLYRAVRLFVVVAALLAAAVHTQAAQAPAAAVTRITELVSVTRFGESGNRESNSPALSADGRYVAFQSDASNLIPGDTNGVTDVFVYDSRTKTPERVSVATGGAQGNGRSYSPAISSNGQFIVFISVASNLVSGDPSSWNDIFVHDRVNHVTERISVSPPISEGLEYIKEPVISGDGRYIVFISSTTDFEGMVIFDRVTRQTKLAKIPASNYAHLSITDNGRYFVFFEGHGASRSGEYDRLTETVRPIGPSLPGGWFCTSVESPFIARNGRYVVFTAFCVNPATNTGSYALYLYDRQANTSQAITPVIGGTALEAKNPTISDDGRYAAFEAQANPTATRDIFVLDRGTMLTERVSVANNGSLPDQNSALPKISSDGRSLAYLSSATNLVPDDTNGAPDVFRTTVRLRTFLALISH